MSRRISPPDTVTALKIYLSHPCEIGNDEIKKLFSIKSHTKVLQIKREVQAKQAELGIKVWNPHCVNTEVAYSIWNIDISKLERNYKKLKSLTLAENES